MKLTTAGNQQRHCDIWHIKTIPEQQGTQHGGGERLEQRESAAGSGRTVRRLHQHGGTAQGNQRGQADRHPRQIRPLRPALWNFSGYRGPGWPSMGTVSWGGLDRAEDAVPGGGCTLRRVTGLTTTKG